MSDMLKRFSLKHFSRSRIVAAAVVAIGFGLIGLLMILSSHAASNSVSVEAEAGTLSGGATKAQGNVASAGSYVQFGAAPSSTMNIYFGSTHNHTGCCNDHSKDGSTVKTIFDTAKANGFDWLILTEHSGHTGPISQGIDPVAFYADVYAQAASHTDKTFVGLPGYEFSDNDGGGGVGKGHMTGVNTEKMLNADGLDSNAATLEDYLVAQRKAGRQAFGGFNHPGAGGHPGSAPALLSPARQGVIVMTENFNSMESINDSYNTAGMIVELDRGWHVAPTCGLDGHGIYRLDKPDPGPCRTGLLAPSLTKSDLEAAFMARRMYSTRDLNLHLEYKANDQWMGSVIGTPANVTFDIKASDPDTSNAADTIKKMQILTQGGTVVASQTFNSHSVSWKPVVPANNKKYFFVEVWNGERSTYTAAGAPVWLE